MIATYKKYTLNFKQPSGTSRGILTTKETWFIIIEYKGEKAIGECGILRGLSIDDRNDYEQQLAYTCKNIHKGLTFLLKENIEFPSIQMGLEMVFKSLNAKDKFVIFPSAFTNGKENIPINGLIWMGAKTFMTQQIKEKIKTGFSCIKLKIGAIDFNKELDILKYIRKQFNESDIEIRVDANGAFKPEEALDKLKKLSDYKLHSIEQPIAVKQHEKLAQLCELTPLPIALDEELIGVFTLPEKQKILQTIKPQYIILKPSFIGGFTGTNQWIDIANKQNIGWWITSALESNIGLNAIAQYTFTKQNKMPQGLGTGSLFANNFNSPLQVKNGTLHYNNNLNWNFNL